ncbi:MAG: nucleoside triphosphate pyrophosphohydrolase [Halothiobacillaceae bacterium]|nr:MAG: nucleoside triphosphate pyrophosphohydrolase [Halothiobacillaceae bacterium]
MPVTPPDASLDPMRALLELMAALRHPEQGCPWDVKQSFATIAPYTLEEAYEVLEAIARQDMGELREELGDLLFQVVYHARMAEEAGHFGFDDVARGIVDKMVRRHPHVFGEVRHADEAGVKAAWEAQKAAERAAKGGPEQPPSALDGVALALPALTRAVKLQKRAARQGFDWPDADAVFPKIDEELAELREGIAAGDRANVFEEIGDLLFAITNLARKLGMDPEAALRGCNDKFIRRYQGMETVAEGRKVRLADLTLDEQEAIYREVKARLATGGA